VTNALDYNGYIATETARFVDVIRRVESTVVVPTCPLWSSDDLLWHVAAVQDFWATIVVDRMTTRDEVTTIDPPRPADRLGLLEFFDRGRAVLLEALRSAPDDTEVWAWSRDDHSVGFIRRRFAHEALIHRLDAELTAGTRTAMDPALASDGVDEALRVMHGGAPSWATFEPDGGTVTVEAVDTDRCWIVALGRLVGVRPATGLDWAQAAIRVVGTEPAEAAAQVRGAAADLDCWLWGRPTVGPVTVLGAAAALESFTAVVSTSINA
jgi:uncharacterized protein (TIGR03083 family)